MIDGIYANERPVDLPDGVIQWPDSLPDILFSGSGFEDIDSRKISEFDQGPPRVRSGFVNEVRYYSANLILSQEQLAVFIDFYKSALYAGRLATMLVVSDERGSAYSYVKFSPGARKYKPVNHRGYFSLSLTVFEVGRP